MDEMFGRNLFSSDKIVESYFFVIVKTNVFRINGGRLVLHFEHVALFSAGPLEMISLP